MKKRGITLAALAIACVFVVTIIVFAACIYSDYNSGLKTAGAKFEKLSSRTAEASGIYSSGSKEFLNLFNSAVGSPEIFDSIKLEVNGQAVYVYPMQEQPQASVFVKAFSTRISGSDGADIRLNATIYTVAPAIIFYRAKIAFIIVLAGTLAACVILMYLYLSASEKEDYEGDVDFKKTSVNDDFGESLFDEEESSEEVPEEVQEEVPEEKKDLPPVSEEKSEVLPERNAAQEAEPQESEEKVDFNPLENAYADQQAQKASEATEDGSVQNESSQTEEQESIPPLSEDQGLFSPASGFGWESYLDARLESELIRAASSEQDLALAMIQIPGMTKESEYYGNVCQTMLDYFQFKDFIFECKEDGFAVIIQRNDIDQALQSAEVLHSNLQGTLSAAQVKAKPLIGISSRSLRLISADRLKNEAEQALIHASDDPDSPIIAFRVNPEKYRKFVNGENEDEE